MKRWVAAVVISCVGSLGLTGCGSDGGDAATSLADLEATEILARSQAAAAAAASVRVAGNVTNDGAAISLDMWFKGNEGAVGTLTTQGLTFQLLRTGDTAFMKADAATWSGLTGDAEAGALLGDQFVKVSITGEEFADFASLLTWESFIAGVLAAGEALTRGATAEIDGAAAIEIVSTPTDEAMGNATLWVALRGEPYPLRLESPGDAASSLAFTEWGSAVDLTSPAADEVIDLTEIGR